MGRPRFGEQRLYRQDVGRLGRAAFRVLGVADPAHWLHHDYLRRTLDGWSNFEPATVLDAGCGRGDYTVYLAQRYPSARVTGVDENEELIARNRETISRMGLENVTFEVGDLTKIKRERAYDLVIAIDVLEHIERQRDALEQLAGALQEGGRFCFHIPTVRARPVPLSRWLHSFHEWAEREHLAEDLTAEEFTSRVRASGYSVERWERTFGYFAGEFATSLFALPYSNTPLNRLAQLGLAPVCRLLARWDRSYPGSERYGVLVVGRRDGSGG